MEMLNNRNANIQNKFCTMGANDQVMLGAQELFGNLKKNLR
jgi:hypothetical protein